MPPNRTALNNHQDGKSPPPQSAPSAAMTPQRPSNNYASLNTPIASAKRPKKSSCTPKTPSLQAPHSKKSLPRTPVAAGRSEGEELSSALLSPMHSVRSVPEDSHHVPTAAVGLPALRDDDDDVDIDGAVDDDRLESKLSIETGIMDISQKGGDGDSPSSSASWVGRKVDAIFSPVLRAILGATNDNEDGGASDTATPCEHESSVEGMKLPTMNLEEELGSLTRTEDSDDINDSAAVSNMVTEALRQAESDMGENKTSSSSFANENDNGRIDTMAPSSSGDHALANDGDVTMADYDEPHSQGVPSNRSDGDVSTDMYCNGELHVPTANDHDAPEEDFDEEEEFNPYLFIKCLPPYRYAIPPGWTTRPKALPPADDAARPVPPVCLVLDLDETLVHCTVEPIPDADMVFPVEFNGTEYQVHVRCRPFLAEFLEAVSRKFEVVIFTASQQVYADKLLDKIDPGGKFIDHRMFRDSCLPVEGNFLKDLTILGRDLSKTVLVDNSPHAFGYQVDNGIPIESWFDDPNDKELLKLEMFLRTLHGVEDVRDVVRKTFRTKQLILDA